MNFAWPSRAMIRVTAVLLASALPLQGQEAPEKPTGGIQRIDVPDSQPQNWPFRDQDWLPRERAEFERIFSRWNSAVTPAAAEWQSIRYTATLSGNMLSAGQFEAELRKPPENVHFLSLGTPTIAVEELAWVDRPAVWGTDLEGANWLQLEPGQDRATGRWSARGRGIESGVVFDLNLLSAEISELNLIVPHGSRVVADVGETAATRINEHLTQWRISLGSHSRVRLLITHQEHAATKPQAVLYEQDLAVEISQEELQLLATLRLEILEGEIGQLTVSLPRHVEIDAVTYGDKPYETRLKWERLPGDGPVSRLQINLPEPIRERSLSEFGRISERPRPVKLEGFQRRVPGEALNLPQVVLEGGVWLNGRLNVNVLRPLEIRSYRPTGYRQDSAVSFTEANSSASSAEGESISFQQLTPRAQLVLNLDRPTPERIAHALNLLSVSGDVWTLRAEIAWESRAGTVFQAACRFPDDWRIVNVEQLSAGPRRRELVGWKVQAHPESGQVLLLDFPDGLTPGRVEPIGIVARRVAEGPEATQALPIFLPLDCESSNVVLAVAADVQTLFTSAQWAPFERFDGDSAAVWNTLPSWGNAQTPATPSRLLFRLTSADSLPFASSRLVREEIGAAEAAVELTFGVERIEERWSIRLDSLPGDRRIELFFPSSTAGSEWSCGQDRPVSVTPERILSPTMSRPQLPPGGELWSIAVPPLEAGEPLLITGVLRRARTERDVVPLVFVPQATSFRGRVSIVSELTEPLEIRERAFPAEDGQSVDREAAARRQEMLPESGLQWEYRTWDREWAVGRGSQELASDRRTIFALESILSSDAQGYDYHKLGLDLRHRPASGELRIRLDHPAEFIAVLRNDQRIPFAASGTEVVVAAPVDGEDWDIGVLYRVPVRRGLLRADHRLIIPRLDWECAGFNWSLCVPPGTVLGDELLGLRLTPEIVRPRWFQRLWGPLARRAGEGVFLPFVSWVNGPPRLTRDQGRAEAAEATHASPGFAFPENWPVYRATSVSSPDREAFQSWSRNSLDMAAWILALLCFPLGIFIRWRPEPWRTLLAGALLSGAASLAVFGPEPGNELCGGAFLGLTFALLLPKPLLRFWPLFPAARTDVMGSTATFQHQVVSVGLVMSLGLYSWRLAAAQQADGDSSFRVLVPVDASGQPSKTMPLVFVSPALAEEFRKFEQKEPRDPEQLIHAVDYMVYADQSQRLAMRVKYQLEEFGRNSPVVLRVPVGEDWIKGLDSCLVDGRPQQPTRATDRPMLLLPLSESAQPADAATTGRRHEVVLEVRLAAGMQELQDTLLLETFPALNSRLSWQTPARLNQVDVPEARGAVSLSGDRRLLDVQLGPVPRFSVIWAKGERTAAQAARTELKLSQLLSLRSSVALSTFRIGCRVLEGAPERLELRIPPGGLLRDLRCHKLLRTISRPLLDGSLAVIVEFTEPQQQEFVVEGDLVFPRSSDDADFEAPRLEVRCGDDAATPIVRSHLAVACGPESEVRLVNPDETGVLPITIEQFVSKWGDTVPTQRPQAAYQLQDGARPSFRLVARALEQQVLSWREEIRLSGRQMNWSLTADVKPTELPTFTQTLLLDRQLEIESATVQENGVERQLRWSVTPSINFSQKRLTIDLNRQPTGTFQLRVAGSMPIRISHATALPVVKFEGSRAGPGTISLFHESAYRLELTGRYAASAELPLSPGTNSEAVDWQHFQTLQVAEGETGLLVRLEPAVGRSVARLGLQGTFTGERWTLEGWLRLVPEEATREVRVRIPAWLSEAEFQDEQGTILARERDGDGQLFLGVACDAAGTPRVLRWRGETPATTESDVSLDLPEVLQATSVETLIALPPDSEWTVDRGTPQSIDSLSPELREFFPGEPAAAETSVYAVPGFRVHLVRTDQLSPDGKSSVLFVEHRLSGRDDGSWEGETDFYPTASAGTVELIVPDGWEILGVLAGSQLLPNSDWNQSPERVRILRAGEHLVLTLRWRCRADGAEFFLLRGESLFLPRSVQQRPPVTMVSILSPPGAWLRNFSGVEGCDPLECRFQRLDVLLRRQARLQSSGGAESGLLELIHEEYRRTAADLADRIRQGRLPAELSRRWEALTESVNQLRPDVGNRSDAAVMRHRWELPVSDEAIAWQGRLATDHSEIDFWQVRKLPFRWGGALLVFAVGGWLLSRCVGWWVGPRREPQHEQVAWLVFGLVWWLCWSPSIVGFAIIAGTLFRSLWRRRSPPQMAIG